MEINWKPVEPPVYQRGDLYETKSVECGYTGLYRWTNMDISTDWICDRTTKYYKQKEQVSFDEGQTWQDVIPYEYQKGTLYEVDSPDCQPIYRWVNLDISTDWICSGTTKYYKQQEQVSFDNGATWENVVPETYRMGDAYEYDSDDCPDYALTYFTIVGVENGKVGFNKPGLSYSRNKGRTWSTFTSTSQTINISAGEKVYFKGNLKYTSSNYIGHFYANGGKYNVEGNIFSLTSGDSFREATAIGENNSPRHVFEYFPVISAENLALVAQRVEYGGYCYMFQGCTLLTKAPKLPAYHVGFHNAYYNSGGGYSCMFSGCTSLVEAPDLPATELEDYCYASMFADCTSLKKIPSSLPATELGDHCYASMFAGCTSLEYVPIDFLPATIVGEYCYAGMFAGCTSLTIMPKVKAVSLSGCCCQDMFAGCTSLTRIFELPATTLATCCYERMFEDCTSLVEAPNYMLPATSVATLCYRSMFAGCTSLVSPPDLPATWLDSNCYQYMFSGCTSLVKAPYLPARTLIGYCYAGMFEGCTSLNYIKCNAEININVNQTTTDWLKNVSPTGNFYKNANVNWPEGRSGVPLGWTVIDA